MIMTNKSSQTVVNDLNFKTNKDQILWLLRIISESSNIRGADLNIAVKTIARLQDLVK